MPLEVRRYHVFRCIFNHGEKRCAVTHNLTSSKQGTLSLGDQIRSTTYRYALSVQDKLPRRSLPGPLTVASPVSATLDTHV